ncbi:hypothetical protein LIA77_06051 [Sarocladium implicatum]|nr:hypothetical protein LIA77_06051 [Sarocladium implicatum]
MASKRGRDDADDEVAEAIKRRKFYTIAKDQQKILERGNNSYNHIKNQPGGIRGSVPTAVLDGLEARHRRTKLSGNREGKGTKSLSSTDSTQAETTPRKTRNRSQHDSAESSNPQNLQSPVPSSSPGVISSWSESPASPRRRRKNHDPSQRVGETPAVQHSIRQPYEPEISVRRPPPSYNFPSSDGPDEELEVDIPGIHETLAPNANAAGLRSRHLALSPAKPGSSMQNTPPCAQPSPATVPSTLDHAQPITKALAQQNKFKPMDWEAGMAPNRPRNAVIGVARASSQSERSDDVESGLIIPATLEPAQEKLHLRLRSPIRKERTKSTVMGLAFTDRKVSQAQRRSIQPSPALPQSTPRGDNYSQAATEGAHTEKVKNHIEPDTEQVPLASSHENMDSQTPPERQVESTHDWSHEDNSRNQTTDSAPSSTAMPKSIALEEEHDPYRHFTMIYPSYEGMYNGSRLYFVRAAAVLQHLRSELSLKSALYDDFVRAFAGGYMSYAKAAGPNRECMPAFEWYNWKDEDILFASGVLKRGNLDLIKKAYPKEFEEARKLFAEDTQAEGVNEASGEIRETIEVAVAEEAVAEIADADESDHDEMMDDAEAEEDAEAELGEPELPSRTNGAYLIIPQPAAKTFAARSAQNNTPPTDGRASEEPAPLSRRSYRHRTPPVCNLAQLSSTASHGQRNAKGDITNSKSSIRRRGLSEKLGSSPRPTMEDSPVVDLTGHEASPDVEPPAVPPQARAGASNASAQPSPQPKLDDRVVSAPMPPPRPTSRLGSNAPPSSSSIGRRVSSSAASTASSKPRPSGMSYLQRLKLKGGGDQARGARMRELGRAKRMSSGASVASSHASSK